MPNVGGDIVPEVLEQLFSQKYDTSISFFCRFAVEENTAYTYTFVTWPKVVFMSKGALVSETGVDLLTNTERRIPRVSLYMAAIQNFEAEKIFKSNPELGYSKHTPLIFYAEFHKAPKSDAKNKIIEAMNGLGYYIDSAVLDPRNYGHQYRKSRFSAEIIRYYPRP